MKTLTRKYALHQMIFWSGSAGVVSFAAAYLLDCGFTTAQIGFILFFAYVLSFLLQPVLGSVADKVNKNILPALTAALLGISCLCFLSVFLFKLPLLIFSILYLVGVLCVDMQMSMMNSLAVFYTGQGYDIKYGLSRGLGGLGFAVATLGFGYLIEYAGAKFVPLVSVLMLLICIAITFTYPKHTLPSSEKAKNGEEAPVSLFQFVVKYKSYCLSLFGILLFAVFHVMIENYFIEIFRNIGGDSTNVGMALFIATITEFPAMSVFPALRRKIGTGRMIVIGAAAYTLKAFLLIMASSALSIYLIQLLQCLSYVPLSMSQMYYARYCTEEADMVKGQTMITAFYTLGCAFGNLLGGVVISAFGVRNMLFLGLAITLLGSLAFVFTLPKTLKRA